MSVAWQAASAARLIVDYVPVASLSQQLQRTDTLAVFGFGRSAPGRDLLPDPRYLNVPLQPLPGQAQLEVWRTAGPVEHGEQDGLRWASDGELQFGVLELEEPEAGILPTSEVLYERLTAFWRRSDYPHLLRIWNYFADITQGDGDAERYRQFCVGRVRGLGALDLGALPAATAIGSRERRRVLQVYWLSARQPGAPLENPRQVSAYRYPREYGPQSPSFARALLPQSAPALPLFLSGTAAIVGHASQHADSLKAQLDETLTNLDSVIGAARALRPDLPPHLDASSRLKVYVRDAVDADRIAAQLSARLGDGVPYLMLQADVCRRELSVEIEGMHGVSG